MTIGRASAVAASRRYEIFSDAVGHRHPTTGAQRAVTNGGRPPPVDERPNRDLAVAVLDAVAEAIMVFDPSTFVIGDVNRGACDLLRRTRDELVGHRIDDLLPPAESRRLALIVRPLASGERDMATVMLPYRLPNGSTISVEVILQTVDLDRGGVGIVAIARDISERIEVQVRLQRLAQSEHARAAELNAVIRAMGEAVIVCTADGAISLTNPAGEQIFPDV